MKKFQIILSTLDYGQTKVRNVRKNTFAQAASEANLLSRMEWERTGLEWRIVSIHDLESKFDPEKPIT
jgi:hypothetical protein